MVPAQHTASGGLMHRAATPLPATRRWPGATAGLVSRALATVIDLVVVLLAVVIAVQAKTIVLQLLAIDPTVRRLTTAVPALGAALQWLQGPTFAAILAIIIVCSYFIFFWSLVGQTLGKRVLGLRLVTTAGRQIGVWRAIFRFICWVVVLFTLGLTFLVVLFDSHRLSWHDRLTGTRVIYADDTLPQGDASIEGQLVSSS
jgi:uncharacterized RDD family membrane protein YckC